MSTDSMMTLQTSGKRSLMQTKLVKQQCGQPQTLAEINNVPMEKSALIAGSVYSIKYCNDLQAAYYTGQLNDTSVAVFLSMQ